MAQKKNAPATETKQVEFVFGKTNYRLMLLCIGVVLLGFILMTGTTDIYSFRKIVLAPIVVLAGFAIGFVAILRK
ncbi:DUF3098 domain-containing protein [Hufsiella ginkgonis]|uniref:DUF3098 domain-containing protein n=1 Tax=Hufsiella ginkgonis TaxID=2695274 RepID=A0A7K1Y1Q1_9SPHI|nr:DUF3098 domain-containing protein [Hufsiella ginkgonis]MXV17151.1 DUF3098 domain-containing protein [Hufsiella ginkgonis]